MNVVLSESLAKEASFQCRDRGYSLAVVSQERNCTEQRELAQEILGVDLNDNAFQCQRSINDTTVNQMQRVLDFYKVGSSKSCELLFSGSSDLKDVVQAGFSAQHITNGACAYETLLSCSKNYVTDVVGISPDDLTTAEKSLDSCVGEAWIPITIWILIVSTILLSLLFLRRRCSAEHGKEFSVDPRKLSLGGCPCGIFPKPLLLFALRVFAFCWTGAVVLGSMVANASANPPRPGRGLTFYTVWNYLLLCVFFGVATCVSIRHHLPQLCCFRNQVKANGFCSCDVS